MQPIHVINHVISVKTVPTSSLARLDFSDLGRPKTTTSAPERANTQPIYVAFGSLGWRPMCVSYDRRTEPQENK